MRKAVMVAVAALVVAVGVASLVSDYLEAEAQRYQEAVRIIEQESLKQMMIAAKEGNTQKLCYYRWRYNNVAKVIADAEGASNIIAGQKRKNR